MVHQVLNSPGKPLDSETRGFFEPRFGHDFSRVRIHADGQAAESAKAVRARAYTVGNHVAFGSGNYAPQGGEGRKLLAHELAHAVQQSQAGATPVQAGNLQVSQPGDAGERQAEAAAQRVLENKAGPAPALRSVASLDPMPGTWLQRQSDEKQPSPAARQLSKDIHEAAVQAAQKVHEKGLDKLPEHVPTAPQQRPAPATSKPAEPENQTAAASPEKPAVRPPAASTNAPAAPKADPGSREAQLAGGIAAQSGPTQAGVQVQGALQDKNWAPGATVDFLKYFHLQLGVLQPTLTLQLTHLKPVSSGAGSAAMPLPPPDTAQVSGTISPAVLKVGDFTIAAQVGLAAAAAGDVLGTTSGPGKSGTHGQLLGVVNLQVDYALSKRVSLTGEAGLQEGVDFGPQGTQETGNVTGSVLATFHF